MATLKILFIVQVMILLFALSGRGFQQIFQEKLYEGPVVNIVPTHDGLVSLDANNVCKVIKVDVQKKLVTIKHLLNSEPGGVGYLKVLSDGKILTQVSPCEMRLSGEWPRSKLCCNGKIQHVVIDSDAKKLLVITDRGAIMPWFYKSNDCTAERFHPTEKYVLATFGPEKTIIAATDQNKLVTLNEGFEIIGELVKPDNGTILALEFDSHNKRLLVATSRGVYVWDREGTRTTLFTTSRSTLKVKSVTFSTPDKQYFWIRAGEGNGYEVRNANTGDLLCSGNSSIDYRWSCGSKYLFNVENQNTLNIRSVPDFHLRQYCFDSADITAAGLWEGLETSAQLVTGHTDGSIRMYRLAQILAPSTPSTPSDQSLKIIVVMGKKSLDKITREQLNAILKAFPNAPISFRSSL